MAPDFPSPLGSGIAPRSGRWTLPLAPSPPLIAPRLPLGFPAITLHLLPRHLILAC